MATLNSDNDEAIDLDIMWLHSLAEEIRQGKAIDPHELDALAIGIAVYIRQLRMENERKK